MYKGKTFLDKLGAFVLLVLSWPIMVLAALAIWLEIGKPVIFRQKRVGHKGKIFEIFKFRSMRHDAEAQGQRWAALSDLRVTRVGQFIRKTKIDELPQVFNILRGEMSLVGPRPEVPRLCDWLEKHVPHFKRRHDVRPGLTGLAQIHLPAPQDSLGAMHKTTADLLYVKGASLRSDLEIISKTFGWLRSNGRII